MSWSTCQEIADAVGRNKGNVYKDLQELASAGYIVKHGNSYAKAGQEKKRENEGI
jgi:predicted transcriptional regulator